MQKDLLYILLIGTAPLQLFPCPLNSDCRNMEWSNQWMKCNQIRRQIKRNMKKLQEQLAGIRYHFYYYFRILNIIHCWFAPFFQSIFQYVLNLINIITLSTK